MLDAAVGVSIMILYLCEMLCTSTGTSVSMSTGMVSVVHDMMSHDVMR